MRIQRSYTHSYYTVKTDFHLFGLLGQIQIHSYRYHVDICPHVYDIAYVYMASSGSGEPPYPYQNQKHTPAKSHSLHTAQCKGQDHKVESGKWRKRKDKAKAKPEPTSPRATRDESRRGDVQRTTAPGDKDKELDATKHAQAVSRQQGPTVTRLHH